MVSTGFVKYDWIKLLSVHQDSFFSDKKKRSKKMFDIKCFRRGKNGGVICQLSNDNRFSIPSESGYYIWDEQAFQSVWAS
mmetsp:Transcript_7037/g.11115  ORF Transcript_7037/g.11115 Transcript_7037/m.11115 type:complete len:80 (+) Transcript_7037:346-585(+)